MGVCPLAPELRVIRHKNEQLIKLLQHQLQDILRYGFAAHLNQSVSKIASRYLYNQGILEDIDKIHFTSQLSLIVKDDQSLCQSIEEQIKNSCLILENQGGGDLDWGSNVDMGDSFQNNLKNNQSLVVQINIIYSREIKQVDYNHSLKFFLRWAQIFQQHSYGGFLKPIYRQFCHYLYSLRHEDFEHIVDETCVFVQYIVAVLTQIYGLKEMTLRENGKLIKNQNVYNLVMSFMFKRTKIKQYLLICIRERDSSKIKLFGNQLLKYRKHSASFFGVQRKFVLQQSTMTESQIVNNNNQNAYVQPYASSLRLVSQLNNNGSPVTKLKTIIAISKQIVKEVRAYYTQNNKQAPELDPDNLSSIIIYLLIKNGDATIYEQLKIVQNFTTTNCLNCISGYYLNCFSAAIETILQLQN